jgi:hypothetical protein
MKMLRSVMIATLVLAVALPAAAQREEMRERVAQKIERYLTVELSSRLSLDDKRIAQLADAVRKQMKRKRERRQALRAEMRKLNELVAAKASDAQIKSQLDVVAGLVGHDDDVKDFIADTGKFLSVREQAQLALAAPEILREVRLLMRDARGRRGGP